MAQLVFRVLHIKGLQKAGIHVTCLLHHGIHFSDVGPTHKSYLRQTGMNPVTSNPMGLLSILAKGENHSLLANFSWNASWTHVQAYPALVFLYKILNGKVAVVLADSEGLVVNSRPSPQEIVQMYIWLDWWTLRQKNIHPCLVTNPRNQC